MKTQNSKFNESNPIENSNIEIHDIENTVFNKTTA